MKYHIQFQIVFGSVYCCFVTIFDTEVGRIKCISALRDRCLRIKWDSWEVFINELYIALLQLINKVMYYGTFLLPSWLASKEYREYRFSHHLFSGSLMTNLREIKSTSESIVKLFNWFIEYFNEGRGRYIQLDFNKIHLSQFDNAIRSFP